jgi:hypothetical protein
LVFTPSSGTIEVHHYYLLIINSGLMGSETNKKPPIDVSQPGEISYQGASTNLYLLGFHVRLRKIWLVFHD